MSLLNNSTPVNKSQITAAAKPKAQVLSLLFAGLLPVIIFTVIEDRYGIIAGLIAGMIFGAGEVVYELIRYKKVSTLTWVANALILGLGGISLLSQDGIWFKLQPALIEAGLFLLLFGSWMINKPFLKMMIEKQNPEAPEFLKNRMSGLTLRLSIFMLAHAIIATWAALNWSSEAWALLKGVGLTFSLIIYMLIEVVWTRKQLMQKNK